MRHAAHGPPEIAQRFRGLSPGPSCFLAKARMGVTGLTLIELAVTVAIIAIVSAAGLLSLSRLLSGRLEAETRVLVADLSWARSRTIATRSNHTVVFDPGNDRYTISDTGGTLKTRSLEVDLVSVSPAGDLTFTAPYARTQSKQITLSYRGQTILVTVFGDTGYIKLG